MTLNHLRLQKYVTTDPVTSGMRAVVEQMQLQRVLRASKADQFSRSLLNWNHQTIFLRGLKIETRQFKALQDGAQIFTDSAYGDIVAK